METATRNIPTLEEYTLYSLDRSVSGLEELIAGAQRCCELIQSGHTEDAIGPLASLSEQIRNFDVFQHQLCSIFLMDPNTIKHSSGSLEDTMTRLQAVMTQFSESLSRSDWDRLTHVLAHDLVDVLTRTTAMIPVVREFIVTTYIKAA